MNRDTPSTSSEPDIAHIAQNPDGTWRTAHDLAEHLSAVAALAACFARGFGEDWAHLAGLWHDLGKYRPAFQTYIRNQTGFERENAHIEGQGKRVEHSAAGALHAIATLGELPGRLLAYLIAGHHAGLPDWNGGPSSLFQRLERAKNEGHLQEALSAHPPQSILDADGLKPSSRPKGQAEDLHLWLQMLFSCLVDADCLDTEAYKKPGKSDLRANHPSLDALLCCFNDHMNRLRAKAPVTPVNALRARVLDQCIERARADRASGLFSLTVPTGGGKTLASLAFALHHARAHGKRRVIYVIPYLSIIEQTANVFRQVFGDEVVIEHHSHLDPDKEDRASRLAAENWDAPLIVTTNVQFFESLYASRPSRCRKLHNIVDAVVILDEAQLLPPEWVDPCLAAIRTLAAHYGVSFVLCTATQPAFRPLQVNGKPFAGLADVQELMQGGPHVQSPKELYAALERVEVHWPATLDHPQDWDGIAQQMATYPQALAIVNRKSHARALAERLPGAIYLSTNLCGAHRAERIEEIRRRLEENRQHTEKGLAPEPLYVVSTQLIEAGVDVDFPVVFRALAGLDAIAQAAGRCNREGRLEKGRVHIFVPPETSPPGLLLKAEQATRELLPEGAPTLSPEWFDRYSRLLLAKVNTWDKADIRGLLMPGNQLEFRFREAAEKFRLIDDAGLPVIVRWGKSCDLIERLAAGKPDRWLMRKLQRYTVSVHPQCLQKLLARSGVREVPPGLYVQENDLIYDETFGFLGCERDTTL